MINILQGSIFDAKCDLLIVPCDNMGGVTNFVASSLRSRQLPTKIGPLPYGSLIFRDVRYEYASTIGYAASVDVESVGATDTRAIVSIARQILRYALANDARAVNIPLLGAGAGGLTEVASFQALDGVLRDTASIDFNIFSLTPEAYRNIISFSPPVQRSVELQRPRVFISYARNDSNNALWTKRLAQQLRQHGVDARIDVFPLKPGYDLPQWMTNEVIQADKVLPICDQYYAEKANVRKGGAGWETMIIQGDMLTHGDNTQKYIAIVREDQIENSLPIYLKSKYALYWGKTDDIDEERLKELILILFDSDVEPELGPVPNYVSAAKKGQHG